jgi:translation initiation factor 1 (eIF-1/SUI1)
VGSLPSIRIFEKKQRNKKVTIIQGVEFFEIDIKELASRLQRVLSSGTTITERVTTDHVKLDVTIQGFKAKLMVPILTGYYKVPSSSINLD